MSKQEWINWGKAALIRAIRTVAQVLLAWLPFSEAGTGVLEIDWRAALSIAALAGVGSVLMSVVGLPEVAKSPGQSQSG